MEAIKTAFKHVKSIFPTLEILMFDNTGRWCYMDGNLKPFNFEGKNVDQSILEEASDNVPQLPFVFHPTEAELANMKFEEGDTYWAVEPKENEAIYNFAYVSQSCWDDQSEPKETNFETLEEALRYCKANRLTNLQIGMFEGYGINVTIN